MNSRWTSRLAGCSILAAVATWTPISAVGRLIEGEPSLAFNAERLSTLPRDESITNGRNEMPAYGAVMSQDDLQDLASDLLQDHLAGDR